MTDWQVGDLALCLDVSPHDRSHEGHLRALKTLERGKIYTVSGLGLCCFGVASLFLDGVKAGDEEYGFGWAAYRFRKIRPSAIEHIEALKRLPVGVQEDA